MAEVLEAPTDSLPTPGRGLYVGLGIGVVGLIAASYALAATGALSESAPLDVIGRVIASVVGVGVGVFTVNSFVGSERPVVARAFVGILGMAAAVALWWGYLVEPKVRSTVIGVLVAIFVSAGIFVAANKWFDVARTNWPAFTATTGAVTGTLFGVLLIGNRLVGLITSTADRSWWLLPVIAGAGAATGYAYGRIERPMVKLAACVGGGLVMGAVIGVFFRSGGFPRMQSTPLILWPLGLAAVGFSISKLRSRSPMGGILLGATFGWFMGAWLIPASGGGTIGEAILGSTVLGALAGAWLGARPLAAYRQRIEVESKARAVIFLAPALLFIFASLVLPTIRTIYLSFLDARSVEAVGFANYADVLSDANAINFSNWSRIFTSSLTWWAVAFAVVGVVAGVTSGKRVGRSFDANGASVTPIAMAVVLLAFSIFAALRGTIFNNLWWVFTVTLLATSMGLAIAVLADRGRFENVAKSIIFMPMAISFVGAGLIWRFVYIARPPTKDQTGILNGFWVWVGELSQTPGRVVAVAVLAVLVGGLVFLALRGRRAGANGVMAGSAFATVPLIWVIYRLLQQRLGGVTTNSAGDYISNPVIFLQEGPFNNVWLMVVLIWVQTGFTMVIFSAAIKAVPAELVEASKVDGAAESQTFWRVVIPQIAPTIGVVVTTLIVLVMKVFDIVKVMTNGNFGTEVIANLMWTRGFSQFNVGAGSALAVVLFLSVLPVMYVNIRRMQKEAT